MYILQQLYSINSLSTAGLGQVIIKIMQLKILLRVQWTPLVVRGLKLPHLNISKQLLIVPNKHTTFILHINLLYFSYMLRCHQGKLLRHLLKTI